MNKKEFIDSNAAQYDHLSRAEVARKFSAGATLKALVNKKK